MAILSGILRVRNSHIEEAHGLDLLQIDLTVLTTCKLNVFDLEMARLSESQIRLRVIGKTSVSNFDLLCGEEIHRGTVRVECKVLDHVDTT